MCNLLIATMASTYEEVRAAAVLEWRLRFSRMVFNMELLEPRESIRNKLKDRLRAPPRRRSRPSRPRLSRPSCPRPYPPPPTFPPLPLAGGAHRLRR